MSSRGRVRRSDLKVNTGDVMGVFKQLGSRHMIKAHKRAMTRSLKVLVREAKSNLATVIKNRTGNLARRGVRMRVDKYGRWGKVHIFSARLIELGTQERRKDSGARTGKMTKRPFFAKSKAAAQGMMESEFEASIVKYVEKVAQQK